MKFCSEIQYSKQNGESVHSDICFACGGDGSKELTNDHRQLLHDCLDEWLNKSDGTGFFFVANREDLINEFREDTP
jgi:hypothetical protein